MTDTERELVAAARAELGNTRLAVGVFDASLPSTADEDVGRGSPYSAGAARFFEVMSDLGFDVVQLGPQGETSDANPSPYDGTLFARATASLALAPLTEPTAHRPSLLGRAALDALVAARPPGERRAHHRYAAGAARRAIAEAHDALGVGLASPTGAGAFRELADRFAAFRARHAWWLVRDALYDALCVEHAQSFWRDFRYTPSAELDRRLFAPLPGEEERARARRRALEASHRELVERHAFAQFLLRAQHDELRERLARRGLAVYGDLQVGVSERDFWAFRAMFLAGWRMGAPPSRTNPEGQAWGYPVLDPARYGVAHAPPDRAREGPALAFLRARLVDAFEAYDGVRIDHPHGIVDPWVYEPDARDPLAAVRRGARLFSAPDAGPLAAYAIAREEQLDRARPRWDDAFVRALDDDQVARYAAAMAVVVDVARALGRDPTGLAVEVLSTMPFPLARVLARFGLGRFRVTQKASVDDPRDGYRSENAEPPDWIMIGNHDTPPIWRLLDRWAADGSLAARARRVAERVAPHGAGEAERVALARSFVEEPRRLALAHAAELFTSRARHALVFVGDLLGWREIFNTPGTVSDENWSLRVAPDFEAEYRAARARGDALDLRRALAMALRARGGDDARALAGKLDALAGG